MNYEFQFLVRVCLGDGTAAEKGDFGDGGRDEHMLEDGVADEPCMRTRCIAFLVVRMLRNDGEVTRK